MKRLAIYVHNDSAGRVQDYIIHCLKGLQEVINEILVVVNGNISYEGRRKLESLNVGILVRDNIGFDWSGWKAGIEHYGYDKSELVVGYQPRKLLDFLEKEKLYDTKLIWQDLLSNHHLSKINDNLNLNYILPSELA